MPEMKGITVKIPAELHAEVKAYIEAHGMTMGEFIAQAVDNELHPKIQITQEDKNMERMRTLAFQVPDSLFQRVKAYLCMAAIRTSFLLSLVLSRRWFWIAKKRVMCPSRGTLKHCSILRRNCAKRQ